MPPTDIANYRRRYYLNNKHQIAVTARIRYSSDPESFRKQARLYQKKSRTKAKAEAIRQYGGCCKCCGESWLAFLTIDHISGGGRKHRTATKTTGGGKFYTWLRNHGYPKGYQVMCWTCNCARQFNGGVCPHKTKEYKTWVRIRKIQLSSSKVPSLGRKRKVT